MNRVVGVLLCLLLVPSVTRGGEAAWRDYLRSQAQAEPAASYPYLDCFRAAASQQGLPLTLLLAVARGESNFDPRARSKANALGLMQILWPDTARHLGIETQAALFDPCTNIHAGARYLREMLDRYGGDLHRALAAYNYGPGRIARDGGIPKGAHWYSGYIHRHLGFVLAGTGSGRQVLLRFDRPYRAEAFMRAIERRLNDITLDWSRAPSGGFEVAYIYTDADQRQKTESRLKAAGLFFTP